MSLSRTQICKWLLCDSLMCGVLHLNAGRQTDLNALSSSSVQKQEDTETGFTDTERKEEYCRKAAECTAKGQAAQAHGFKWRRWRTSKWAWNLFKFSDYYSSTTFFIKDQQPVHKDQQPARKDQLQVLILVMKRMRKAMSIVHRVRTLEEQYPFQISAFEPMMNIGQWRLKQKYAAADRTMQLDHYAVCTTIIVPEWDVQ